MTRIRRDLNGTGCCNSFRNGIRTINNQYPDDNRDFDINAGPGILITPATGGITISNTGDTQSFIEGTNIKFTPNGDDLEIGTTDDITVNNATMNGNLNVNGNIYNQGASYESHMEQVYTEDDYIVMRDNAVTGLGSGDFSGFQVKLYDGVNDGRLVIDNAGTARVGDVGDEQPLLTRDESADLTDGDLLKWDGTNQKAIDAGKSISDLQEKLTPVTTTFTVNGMNFNKTVYGKEIIYSCIDQLPAATGTFDLDTAITDRVYRNFTFVMTSTISSPVAGYAYLASGTNIPKIYIASNSTYCHVELRVLTY